MKRPSNSQIVEFSLGAIKEILDQGLKHSTWAEEFPEAYKDLLQYREDLAVSVAHSLCDTLSIERFNWAIE